jgi:hypothetical protein
MFPFSFDLDIFKVHAKTSLFNSCFIFLCCGTISTVSFAVDFWFHSIVIREDAEYHFNVLKLTLWSNVRFHALIKRMWTG